jgi:hypothetical protein
MKQRSATPCAAFLLVLLIAGFVGCDRDGDIETWEFQVNVTVRDKNNKLYPAKGIDCYSYKSYLGRKEPGASYDRTGMTDYRGRVTFDGLVFDLERVMLGYSQKVMIILQYSDGGRMEADSVLTAPSLGSTPDQGPRIVTMLVNLEREEKP